MRFLLWFVLAALLLTACSGSPTTPVLPSTRAADVAPATNTAPVIPSQPPASPTPRLVETSAPTAAPADEEIKSTPLPPRPPAGWTIFTNPDYVLGIAVHDGSIWAASRGGVVRWDLKTGSPRLFTTQDGLAEIQGSDVVYCNLPEPRMFVAHPSGLLSVYDIALEKWSRMPITFDDGSTLRGIHTLLCDAENRRLIVGSSDGLGVYDQRAGHWKYFGPKDGLIVDTIHAVDVVGQAIWVAAGDRGAYMIMGSTVFPYNQGSGFPKGSVHDLAASSDTSVWFGYSTGLVHYRDKKWNTFGSQTSSGIPFYSIDQVELGPDRRIWIASADEGVCPFDTITLFCSTFYPGIRGAPITDLIVDEQGVGYVSTDGGGVLVLGQENVRQFAFDLHQLSSNNVIDIAQSADGRIWVATDLGIDVVDPFRPYEPWATIEPDGSPSSFQNIAGLFPAKNGMWIFYRQEPQASFFDGKNWLHLDDSQGLSGPVRYAALDQRGYTWFLAENGVHVWDGVVMRSYAPPSDMPGGGFTTLLSENGDMWVGTTRGLLRYRRSQWQWLLPGVVIHSIAPDRTGGLLLGTDMGLVRFDGSQSYLWVINLGEEVVTGPRVTSTAWDGSGQLWVGTDGSGLFKYDGVRWERFTTANGLPSDSIHTIYTDSLGAIWIVAMTGAGGGALVRYVP